MAQNIVPLPRVSTPPPRTRSRGRPKGRLNNATLEVRDFFRAFFASPQYRKNLAQRVLAGKANHMEILGHYYAFGKPKLALEVAAPPPLPALAQMMSVMTKEEKRFLFDLANRLQAQARDGQVPATPAIPVGPGA